MAIIQHLSLSGVLTFVLVIGILVFFHELGHFLFAKRFRMKVEDFSLGFGPRMIRLFYDGETEYNLRWLPIGGFVRIVGMEVEDANESAFEKERKRAMIAPAMRDTDTGFETTNTSTMAQEASEVSGAAPDGFNTRPIYQRFWVILGGPLFSFLLGWLVLCLIGVTVGMPDSIKATTAIEQVIPGKPAARAGLQKGDAITAIDGKTLSGGEEMINILHASANKSLSLAVRSSDGATRTVSLTPEAAPDAAGGKKTVGLIGIVPHLDVTGVKRVSLGASFAAGTRLTGQWFVAMAGLFSHPAALSAGVGGPVKIFKASQEASAQGSWSVMSLLGQLSLSLGLFNLLPVPILDGGHITLMVIEAVRRRKLSAEQTGYVTMAGLGLIGVVAILVMFRDVFGLFAH